MAGIDRLDPEIRQAYEQIGVWDVRYTQAARDVRDILEEHAHPNRVEPRTVPQAPGDFQTLLKFERDLTHFPPNPRTFELAQDLSGAAVSVRVSSEASRVKLSAEYRLIQEECAIFDLIAGLWNSRDLPGGGS